MINEAIVYLGCAGLLIWFGYTESRKGVRAIRERAPAIGMMDPKTRVVSGPAMIIAGLVIMAKYLGLF